MKRYDFDRYEKAKKGVAEDRYYIFDRQGGSLLKIATVYDVADAEMICSALNAAARPSEPADREVLEQAKAALLRMRTASIAGCEEGYGKPEKWADELFASHGTATAAIKAIDAELSRHPAQPVAATPAGCGTTGCTDPNCQYGKDEDKSYERGLASR